MITAAISADRRAVHGPRSARRWWTAVLAVALAGAYPAFVLGYVYWHALTAGFPGARHGPQDAYRHVLASGVVAYTVSPRAVDWVSAVMEFGDDPGSRMDRHNNAIGASIGASATSFRQIRPEAERRVRAGRVDARDPEQVTWLPRGQWSDLPF